MLSDADKTNIMSMNKRGFLLFLLTVLILAGLYAEDSWQEDAALGNGYFQAGDYDAAWLFYERALSGGCDDGMALFQAAESFRLQELPDNPRDAHPEYVSRLYAVARYFLEGQYPDSSAFKETEKYIEEGTVVNRRFLRETYAEFGGKAPKKPSGGHQIVSSGFGLVSDFFLARLETMGTFIFLLGTGDFGNVLVWVKDNFWNFLFSILVLNSLTGIILPVVMAITVAREGRKSYVTAYAFLIHWGMLGIHRFYMGRYISGIVWLFTGGLFGIGLFFDIFLTGAYIRFWNEDHRDERPINRSEYTGKIKQPRVKKVKTPKAPKAPKVPKAVKKSKKSKKSRKEPVEVDTNEEFSFPVESAAVLSAVPESEPVPEPEPELASVPDLPDLEDADLENSASPAVPEPDITESDIEFDTESDDNEFGDLPDLSFDEDDGLDDFSLPSELPDDSGNAGDSENNDDEFDISSLE